MRNAGTEITRERHLYLPRAAERLDREQAEHGWER